MDSWIVSHRLDGSIDQVVAAGLDRRRRRAARRSSSGSSASSPSQSQPAAAVGRAARYSQPRPTGGASVRIVSKPPLGADRDGGHLGLDADPLLGGRRCRRGRRRTCAPGPRTPTRRRGRRRRRPAAAALQSASSAALSASGHANGSTSYDETYVDVARAPARRPARPARWPAAGSAGPSRRPARPAGRRRRRSGRRRRRTPRSRRAPPGRRCRGPRRRSRPPCGRRAAAGAGSGSGSTRTSACSAPSARQRDSAASAIARSGQREEVRVDRVRRSSGPSRTSSTTLPVRAASEHVLVRAARVGERVASADEHAQPAGGDHARTARSAGRAPAPGRRKQCASQKPMTARERAIRAAGSTGVGGVREAIPKSTSRPNGASAARLASKTGPPVISSTTSTGSPPLASRSRSRRPVGGRARRRRRRRARGRGRAWPAWTRSR